MSYETVVEYLGDALTFGIHPSLDTIRAMMCALGDPQNAFPSIQVTGTNGKTSVTRLTAALLHAQGLRTGCFTSPHLHEYPERIEIDGVPVTHDRFAEAVDLVAHAADGEGLKATEFELLTAAAIEVFHRDPVAFAVFEVGMGGRWDSTSVVTPRVAVITGVGLDHTAHLGDTREEIAADKAHIIKAGGVAVLGPGTAGVGDVILQRAAAVGAKAIAVRAVGDVSPLPQDVTVRFEVHDPGDGAGAVVASGDRASFTRLSVRGLRASYPDLAIAAPSYQAANIATAIAAAEAALDRTLDPEAIACALATVRFPARFEVFDGDPLVVVDGSHNPEAAAVLASAVRERFGPLRPRILLGVLADKDAHGIVEALAPVAGPIEVTAPHSERALPARVLADIVERVTGIAPGVHNDVRAALRELEVAGTPPLLVTGSLTTAAEARSLLIR